MLPTVSQLRSIPKLPEISCDQGDSDVDDEAKEDYGSDEDIEILLRKTKFLRHSKSAHADLALPSNSQKKANLLKGYGIQEEKENSSSDSDEEFYVHQSLLPFRKSKSSTTGFAGLEAKTVEIKNLGTFKASKVLEIIEKQTAEMLRTQEPEVVNFVSNTIDYWPPPEDHMPEPQPRRTSRAKKSIALEDGSNGFPLIPFGRTASVESEGTISVGAWSAPAQVATESENSEDEMVGEEKMRSWSATERPCTVEDDEKFSTKKGISLSCESERSHHCIYDEVVDQLWKGHVSCDDYDENSGEEAEYEREDEQEEEGHDEDRINANPFQCILELEEFSSPNVNVRLQTPSSFTPSPVLSGSKSDSALRFYASDRPKTPLCGEPNPSNSTQEIYDPWHPDVEEASPGPIRSRSCHDTFESTGTEEEARMLRHCQMCPSPDCKQLIEAQRKAVKEMPYESDDEEEDLRIKQAFEAQIAKMQQFAEGETASLLVQNGDEGSFDLEDDGDNKSFTVLDDEIPMADDLTVDSPLNAFLVKKFILNRASPPIASEDDMSDVEMTEIGSDEEQTLQTDPYLRYNISSLLLRKSHSDYGWRPPQASMKTDESVGNLNYWLSQGRTPPVVKRSSTTSALKPGSDAKAPELFSSGPILPEEEPIYVNLTKLPPSRQPPVNTSSEIHSAAGTLASVNPHRMATAPSSSSRERLFPWSADLPPQPQAKRHKITKSATFVGVQGQPRSRNVRRILPMRPDFPATPEEPPEYVNLPYSTSYHEQVGPPSDALCFFPTTSYNCSKERQHENFARIQMQMAARPEQSDGYEVPQAADTAPRPSRLFGHNRGPSFTALTLADELENEKRGMPPEKIDPVLERRITEGQGIGNRQRFEEPSPMSPGNLFPTTKKTQRRTLPALPIDARNFSIFAKAMAQSPTAFPLPVRSHPSANQPPAKEEHQICYGIEASMLRSTSGIYGIEDSYYEDGINGNFTRKSTSVYNNQEDSSGVSSCCTAPDSLTPTHRVQSAFIPRHNDEILLEIGDAIHVDRQCEDHWCYGTNLRTGHHGLFPAAVVCEIDLVEEICNNALANATIKTLPPPERDTFYLTMLASIEVAHHKGNDVLIQSINKICSTYQNKEEIIVPQTVLMEVSFRGIHIIDKRRKDFFKCPAFDFFYSLQNISFCGAHPKQLRYFGFITKHPLLPRFACHVFLSNESTQPIVESIGRAFKRSYDEYMAFAHPTEDIYIE